MGTGRLQGRASQLAELADALSHGNVSAVIAGAAGVGKTRLAQEVAALIGAKGADRPFHVEWLRATPATRSIPFGACASILADAAIPVTAEPLDVLRSVSKALLERVPQGRLLVVVVDDAHLLDDASATMLHQLVATNAATILVTVRSGEPAPQAITALWKDSWARRIDLGPLDRDATARMVAAMLDGPVDGTSADRLYRATAGNALHIREVVLGGQETGAFERSVDGVWQWDGAVPMASRLIELLSLRVSRLDAAERDALDLLAVGEPLSVAVAERIATTGTLASLQDRGLVKHDDRAPLPELRLTHPLYGELLRGLQSVMTRRRSCRRLAEALGADGTRTRTDVLRLALWRLEAGDSSDSGSLIEAAEVAYTLCEWALAERLARAALATRPDARARLVLGRAVRRTDRPADAAGILAPWPDTEDEALRAQTAAEFAAIQHWGLDDTEGAEATLNAALKGLRDKHATNVVVAELAAVLSSAGRSVEAAHLALPLVRDPTVADAVRLESIVPACTGLSLSGRTEEALAVCGELSERAVALAEEHPYGIGYLVAQRVLATTLQGRLDDSEQVLRVAASLTLADRDEQVRGSVAMVLGLVALGRGTITAARAELRQAVTMLRRYDPQRELPFCLALLAQVEGQARQPVMAARLADEATSAMHAASGLYESEVVLAHAWAIGAGGDVDAAWATALDAARVSHDRGHAMLEVFDYHEAYRLGCPAAIVVDPMAQAASACDGAFQRLALDHVTAVIDTDAEAIEAAARGYEDLGWTLHAAEIWSDAADAHRADGHPRLAALAMARCMFLASRCEGADTPRLRAAGVADLRTTLSGRELDVALGCGAEGSVDEIAERLHLDPRTVDSHLRRALAKLGGDG